MHQASSIGIILIYLHRIAIDVLTGVIFYVTTPGKMGQCPEFSGIAACFKIVLATVGEHSHSQEHGHAMRFAWLSLASPPTSSPTAGVRGAKPLPHTDLSMQSEISWGFSAKTT